MLIKVGRPAAAIDLVPPNAGDDADAFFCTSNILYRAEACWEVGHSSEAQNQLLEANRMIEQHGIGYFRARANRLASRL